MALGKTRKPARAGITHNLVGQRLGRKGQGTRERIVAAMANLLQCEEESPITLSAVAREASIGMSTLYLYFPDLGELALAVLASTVRETDPAFIEYLEEYWPDATLTERVEAFTNANFAFWEKHARLLQLHNSFADARDIRFVRFRQKMNAPVRAMLVRQMGAQPGACAPLYEDCATVMLTGLQRVATVVINPDFAILAGVECPAERDRYVARLALAEARLVEALIRDMRLRSAAERSAA